jgi:hypothetical protein
MEFIESFFLLSQLELLASGGVDLVLEVLHESCLVDEVAVAVATSVQRNLLAP